MTGRIGFMMLTRVGRAVKPKLALNLALEFTLCSDAGSLFQSTLPKFDS